MQSFGQVSIVFSIEYPTVGSYIQIIKNSAVFQVCTGILAQVLSLGTCVPPYSKIHAVSVQILTEWIIISHSILKEKRAFDRGHIWKRSF